MKKEKNSAALISQKKMQDWLPQGQDVAIIIGGADGIDPIIKQQADETWSLSSLTMPHALVRVFMAEQLYRAWSILKGHPYHRE